MDDNARRIMPTLNKDVQAALSGLAKVSQLFILKDRVPVPEPNILKWIEWFRQIEHRIVKYQRLTLRDGEQGAVSTVFLGMTHGMSEGEPLLFETVVLVGTRVIASQQYTTWEDAERGHCEIMDSIIQASHKERSQQ